MTWGKDKWQVWVTLAMACPYVVDKGDKFFCQRTGKECDVVSYPTCLVFKQAFFGNPDLPVRTFAKP